MKKNILVLASIGLLFACISEEDELGNKNVLSNTDPSITIGSEQISAISAVLYGKANLGTSVAYDLKVGFQYSKSAGILPSNSITVEAVDADAKYNYTANITGLEPSTTYYFRSFIRQNDLDTYGETMEFTTNGIESLLATLEATNIEANSAQLNAKMDLTNVKYDSISYGFNWGTSENNLDKDYRCNTHKDSTYTASLVGLSHKTHYWYKAYVHLDNQRYFGNIKSFTTEVVPVEGISLDKTEYTFNNLGNTITLEPTVLPADATDKSIIWSSDNDSVAFVDQTGKVVAVGNGAATITATTNDQGFTATCTITVEELVTDVTAFFPNTYRQRTVAAWYSLTEKEESGTRIEAVFLFNDNSFVATKSNTYTDGRSQERKILSEGDYTLTGNYNNGTAEFEINGAPEPLRMEIINGVLKAMNDEFTKQDNKKVPKPSEETSEGGVDHAGNDHIEAFFPTDFSAKTVSAWYSEAGEMQEQGFDMKYNASIYFFTDGIFVATVHTVIDGPQGPVTNKIISISGEYSILQEDFTNGTIKLKGSDGKEVNVEIMEGKLKYTDVDGSVTIYIKQNNSNVPKPSDLDNNGQQRD